MAKPKHLLAILVLALFVNSVIVVQGIPIIIFDMNQLEEPIQNLPVKSQRVDVEINNGYVVTNVSQMFYNPHNVAVQGTYLFAIPEEAFISNFSLTKSGIKYYGAILPREQAQEQYQEAVETGRTAALLEYMERKQFTYAVSLGPKEFIDVELVYEQVLRKQLNSYAYIHPLETKGFTTNIESLIIDIKIQSRHLISQFTVQGYDMIVQEMTPNFIHLHYNQEYIVPETDLILTYDVTDPMEKGALHITNQSGTTYFMYKFAPLLKQRVDALPKDIVFCIDKSSSMEGEPFEQAQEALRRILPQLNPDDRFSLIFFAGGGYSPFPEENHLLTATLENINAGLDFVNSMGASGGTNINLALLGSLDRIPISNRLKFMVFFTDGLARKGETDTENIVENVADANVEKNVQIFSFGFSWEFNMDLLKKLSTKTQGEAARIHPTENIDDRLTGFFETIAVPFLKDVSIDFGGNTQGVYPKTIPILFNGSEIIVVGKYNGENPLQLTITTESAQGQKIIVDEFDITNPELINPFVPKIWAIHRINYLLDQMLLEGEIPRFIDEIIGLSMEFGLVTPYTSILIDPEALQGEISQEDLLNPETDFPHQTISTTPTTVPKTTPPATTMPPFITTPTTANYDSDVVTVTVAATTAMRTNVVTVPELELIVSCIGICITVLILVWRRKIIKNRS